MSNLIEALITLPFPEELLEQIRSVSPRLKLTVIKARKPDEIPAEVWASAEVLYTNRVLPLPDQAPNLRWIQFHWAGIDHALDEPILQKEDVVATTLSGAATSQMAEYALMMLLALGHRLPDLMSSQRRSEWPQDRWQRFTPLELRSSTVGILGYGSIGRQIARLLREFGATILAIKQDAMLTEDTGYTPEGMGDPDGDLAHRIYPPQALRSMLKECDFVLITLPLTEETRNLIGAEELSAMRPSAFLINISRGAIVEPTALFQALRERRIAGAALDVFTEEPLPPDHPLWKLNNVILTPHISGNTPFYDQRAVALFVENLHRYLGGLPLYNRYIPGRGY